MFNVLNKLDQLICRFLGLNNTEIIPHFVTGKKGKLTVLNTESFKRCAQETPISKMNLKMMNGRNKKMLGIAAGKIMQVILSFHSTK